MKPSLEELGVVNNVLYKNILNEVRDEILSIFVEARALVDHYIDISKNELSVDKNLKKIFRSSEYTLARIYNYFDKIYDTSSVNKVYTMVKDFRVKNDLIRYLADIKSNIDIVDSFDSINARINKIVDTIELRLNNEGFEYRYFAFFNENSYMYNLNTNYTRLKFDIAESGYSYSNSEELAEEVFEEFLENAKNNRYLKNSKFLPRTNDNQLRKLVGWSKSDLIDALAESEYFKEVVQDDYNRIHIYPNIGVRIWRYENNKLPLLRYLSKQRLELIYKYVNNYNRINFKTLCDMNGIDTITVRRMLNKFDPTFLNGKYNDMNVAEICKSFNFNLISRSSLDIKELSENIYFQPGGRYFNSVEKNFNVYMGINNEEAENKIKDLYRKYIINCEDLTITRDLIMFDIIELGLIKQINRSTTREEMCKIIRKYITSIYKYDY